MFNKKESTLLKHSQNNSQWDGKPSKKSNPSNIGNCFENEPSYPLEEKLLNESTLLIVQIISMVHIFLFYSEVIFKVRVCLLESHHALIVFLLSFWTAYTAICKIFVTLYFSSRLLWLTLKCVILIPPSRKDLQWGQQPA